MEKSSLISAVLGLSLGVALMGGQALAGPKVYRFDDEYGNKTISHTIPSGRVKYGFEILDGTTYRVLEVIPPQLTEEQAQTKARHDHDLAVCKAKLRRVKALYRSLDDIDYSEEQALRSLDTRIVDANTNLGRVRNLLGDLQTRAAQVERAGTEPSPRLIANIERAESQIGNLRTEISQRRQEQTDRRDEFEDDRRMLKILDCEVAVGSVEFQPNAAVSKADH